MAYITPNSDVHILKGVSLDRNYNHTLFQTDLTTQYNTFYALKKYTLSNQTYQRAGKNKIRVAILADNLYDCNYIMFRNTAYGSKWFYAFIDTVNYINDNASEIEYTIDVMQTWYFDYELGSCYVEREHTLSDRYYDHLVPENIPVSDLIIQSRESYFFQTQCVLIFYVPNNKKLTANDIQYNSSTGHYFVNTSQMPTIEKYEKGDYVNGVYMGCDIFYWALNYTLYTADELKEIITVAIQAIIETGGTIVNIVEFPDDLWYDWVTTHSLPSYVFEKIEPTIFYNATHSKSYTPKNKKLYNSPYRKVVISNANGQTKEFYWENFTRTDIQYGAHYARFIITGTPLPSPEMMCYPQGYNGLLGLQDYSVTLNNFVDCSWSEDSYAKWQAVNKELYALNLVQGGLTLTAGVIANNASLIAQGGSSIIGSLSEKMKAQNTPDQIGGQVSISGLRIAQNRIGFVMYDMGIEYDTAKMVDDYFSMFGYAIKQTKIPNVRTPNLESVIRPHWNYVKTQECIIHSASGKGLPTGDEEKIAKIYDNGITFWMNISEVGDYSLDNSPRV